MYISRSHGVDIVDRTYFKLALTLAFVSAWSGSADMFASLINGVRQ